ncbi:MAG TPA: ABC transporter permease [Blastocatellia bacterium]|nr:ABC transporter permease [Blastocatellia bacterium]
MIEAISKDVRYAVRMLARNPGFTLIAIATLALGISVNTTVFTWVKGIVLKPLPGVQHSDRLVTLHGTMTGAGSRLISISYPDYVSYRDRNQVFSGVFAQNTLAMNLGGQGHPERVWGSLVSGNFFDVLGVKPVLGRTFLPEEDRVPSADPVAVISYGLWQRRFAGDPNLAGKSVLLNGKTFTIIGIAPRGFGGAVSGFALDVWVPMMMEPVLQGNSSLDQRGNRWLSVMGRLRPGTTQDKAQANLETIAGDLANQYPQSNDHIGVRVFSLLNDPQSAQAVLTPAISVLMAIVGLVLLIACANVANLLLARGAARQREIAIRLAIGAGRGRLVRQLLTESAVLALVGATIGVAVAFWATGLLLKVIPKTGFNISFDLGVDTTVLGFTLMITVFTTFIFGVIPALQTSRADVLPGLKDTSVAASGSPRKTRVRAAFVAVQVALSFVALVAAGLLIRTLRNTQNANPGFDPDNVAVASVDLFAQGYDQKKGLAFFDELEKRLRTAPGIASVALADKLPLRLLGDTDRGASIEGYTPRAGEQISLEFDVVSPDYFQTMKIPLVEGRAFTLHDDEKSQPVVVINQTLARRYFGDNDPIGKTIGIGTRCQVIAIARDAKYYTMSEEDRPYMYLPLAQNYRPSMRIIARSAGDSGIAISAITEEVRSLDANLPVFDVKTLTEATGVSFVAQSIAGKFLTAFGALALVLAAIGLYGVMGYSVAQRRREIGIRMALGATSSDVLRLVISQGMVPVLVGVAIGTGGAAVAARLMSGLLYRVSPVDPLTFFAILVMSTITALMACYLPARRAIAVAPTEALKI